MCYILFHFSIWLVCIQVLFDLPDPPLTGTSWACILAWISSDDCSVSPTQADNWRVSSTHRGFRQQSVSVSFSAHKCRLLSSRRWTRIAVWGTKWNTTWGIKKWMLTVLFNHSNFGMFYSYKYCLIVFQYNHLYLSHWLSCERPLCYFTYTWWRINTSCKTRNIWSGS